MEGIISVRFLERGVKGLRLGCRGVRFHGDFYSLLGLAKWTVLVFSA